MTMGKQLTGATASSSGIDMDENKGRLFVIEPLEVEKGIETTNGVADATRCNAWVVRSKDGTKYDEYEDTLIFQKVLQGQLRKAMGKSVIFGRLTQGTPKPGKNAPWVLADPTPDDTKAATAFWSAHSLAGSTSSDEGGDEAGFDGDDDGDGF
jgi:hypothetical protein